MANRRKQYRLLFILGILFILGAIVNFASFTVLRSGWLETPVVEALQTSTNCTEGKKAKASLNTYDYVYKVDGTDYTLKNYCAAPSATVKTISYDPAEPAKAVPGDMSVYYVLSAGLATIGAGFLAFGYVLRHQHMQRIKSVS